MKVLCLAGAMGQTTMAPTQLECFVANAEAIGQLGDGCLEISMHPSRSYQ